MYFDSPGKENTAKTIELAVQAVKDYDIRHVVLATTTGYTAQCFPSLEGVTVVCVPHAYGFKEPGKTEVSDRKLTSGCMKKGSWYMPPPMPSAERNGVSPENSEALAGGGNCPHPALFRSGYEGLRRNRRDGSGRRSHPA